MKIKKVFIAHSWTDVGINIQTKAVAKKLSETADVTFLSQARIGKPEIIINDHLKVIEWPNKRPNRFKDFFFLISQLRREKPDALIAHFGATNICMIASWLMRIKYRICWMHTLSSQYHLDSKNKLMAKLAIGQRKLAYGFATHVIVLNKHAREDAIDNFGIKAKKIYTIYNGIYNSKVTNRNFGIRKSIRFCGRLDKSKGIDILINAFSLIQMNNKDAVLEIAGRGSEEANIKTMIREMQLGDVIKFHGYFSQYAEALKFISEAYCLVVPSRIDNFPTSILEAMANSVPVIASKVGGIPDMMAQGKEGFLVENEDVEGLAASMKRILENEIMRNEMSAQAIKSFNEKFSMEKHVSNVIDFLKNLN